MNFFDKLPDPSLRSVADPRACVVGADYRFTVLTERLIRIEYAADGKFEDSPSRTAWYRDFPVPEFEVLDTAGRVEIVTPFIRLYHDKKEFSPNTLYADVYGGNALHGTRWYYGAKQEINRFSGNLGGTARTLDGADGETPLECGILSRTGHAVLDDSDSHLLNPDGTMRARVARGGKKAIDLYLFAYGNDYKAALRDFYRLTGPTPLLPRWALGNWWSRYYAYTQDAYLELMERFRSDGIPFSVSVIDMDWHRTRVDAKYGSGWTGYSWNRELFPDPEAFLARLHEMGLRVTLNLHPADGIRAFEDCYPEAARVAGVDPATGKPLEFDLTSPAFVRAYFECAHRPLERQGVDFWWIDWQQGASTRVSGLDPLWMLNHYHYYDSPRRLIFSRYAGPGSHRYPVGFSGDTITSWKSLAFQPCFTATAANAGYGWWSHDIGGHMLGKKDDELVTRWVQFGVFSPINRLHSSCSPFNGKEPWRYGAECRAVIGNFLRLRHALVPYLHSMNRAAAEDARPICLPVYYEHPAAWDAYEIRNEYCFGTELLVVPVTGPLHRDLLMAGTRVWFPAGLWTDFFSGETYDFRDAGDSGAFLTLYRPLDSLPVLAKAGAIVPLARSGPDDASGGGPAGTGVPAALEVMVFPGASNRFCLFEDEATTELSVEWTDDTARFCVSPVAGDRAAAGLPGARAWTVSFRGFGKEAELVSVSVGGKRVGSAEIRRGPDAETLSVFVGCVSPDTDIAVSVRASSAPRFRDIDSCKERVYRLLDRAQIPFVTKDRIWNLVSRLPEAQAAAPRGTPDTPHGTPAAPGGTPDTPAAPRETPASLAVALAGLDLDRDLLLALYEHLPR